jgi:hypothetical protein
VVAGLVFGGIQPWWIRPRYDERLHLAHPPSPAQVEQAWDEHPDAAGALIVGPTPYGTCADIKAVAEACHKQGKPLIVAEAWGAHLPFHEDLPTWAMDAGADVCVVSVHKMGTGFDQGSVFHLQGGLVDPEQLSACADMLMTPSPNVMLYAALDGWRRQIAEHGHALLGDALALAGRVREQAGDLPGLRVLRDELLGAEASRDLDPLHVVIDVNHGLAGLVMPPGPEAVGTDADLIDLAPVEPERCEYLFFSLSRVILPPISHAMNGRRSTARQSPSTTCSPASPAPGSPGRRLLVTYAWRVAMGLRLPGEADLRNVDLLKQAIAALPIDANEIHLQLASLEYIDIAAGRKQSRCRPARARRCLPRRGR